MVTVIKSNVVWGSGEGGQAGALSFLSHSFLDPKEENPIFPECGSLEKEKGAVWIKAGGVGTAGHIQQSVSCVENFP